MCTGAYISSYHVTLIIIIILLYWVHIAVQKQVVWIVVYTPTHWLNIGCWISAEILKVPQSSNKYELA